MAVKFIKSVDEWMPLFNSNYIIFTGDDAKTPIKALLTITINDLTTSSTFEFYAFDKIFTVNISSIIRALLDVSNIVVEDFEVPFSPLVNGSIEIVIPYSDGSTDAANLAIPNALQSVMQIGDIDDDARRTYLHPTTSRNVITLNYWEGYPFAIYTTGGRTLQNWQIMRQKIFAGNRIIVDNGLGKDWTHTNEMPLIEGFNKLTDSNITILIKKHKRCSGVFLRWYNNRGGFDSWLFDENFEREINAKNIGEVQNTATQSIFESSGNILSIGNSYTEELTLETRFSADDYALLRGILTSPRVQMYTSRSAYIEGKFIDVMIDGKSKRVTKKNSEIFTIDVMLPTGNTIKL